MVKAMVVGMARSGTSFAGELFRQNPDLTYVWEPCWGNTPVRRDQLIWRGEDDDWADGSRWLQDVYAGRVEELCVGQTEPNNPATFATREDELRAQFGRTPLEPGTSVVTKCIRFNLQLRWLAAQRDPELKLVHIVRDPRGVVASFLFDGVTSEPPWSRQRLRRMLTPRGRSEPSANSMYKRWGWDEDTSERRVPHASAHVLEVLDHGQPHERVAARCALLAGQALADVQDIPSDRYLLVRYEDLCVDPRGTAEQVYDLLGEPVPEPVTSWLDHNTSGGQRGDRFGTSRDSAAMVDVWRTQLTKQEILDVERVCAPLLERARYEAS